MQTRPQWLHLMEFWLEGRRPGPRTPQVRQPGPVRASTRPCRLAWKPEEPRRAIAAALPRPA